MKALRLSLKSLKINARTMPQMVHLQILSLSISQALVSGGDSDDICRTFNLTSKPLSQRVRRLQLRFDYLFVPTPRKKAKILKDIVDSLEVVEEIDVSLRLQSKENNNMDAAALLRKCLVYRLHNSYLTT